MSACFKRQRDDDDKREAYARSKSPQKSFVRYFLLLLLTEPIGLIIDIEVEVYHAISTITNTIRYETDIALYLEISLFLKEILLLHYILGHDMITMKETLDLIVLLRVLLIDHPTDVTLVTDTALDPPLETKQFQSTILLLDPVKTKRF